MLPPSPPFLPNALFVPLKSGNLTWRYNVSAQRFWDRARRYIAVGRHSAARFSYWGLSATRLLAPYVFVIVLAVAALSDAQAANSSEALVQSGIDKGYVILNDSTLSAGERASRFRALLSSIADLKRIAAFTLGPYGRAAPIAAMDKFDIAFADFVTAIYQRNLEDYSGRVIRMTGSFAQAPDDSIVSAEVERTAKEPPLKIAFRVRKNEIGNDKIVDFRAKGIWLALSERDDFAAFLQRHGDVARLADEVERRAQHIRGGATVAVGSASTER